MGVFNKSDKDESRGQGWPGFLAPLIFLAAGALIVFQAPGLNNKLFQSNKNMVPLTGSLWILALPDPENLKEMPAKTLIKIAEPRSKREPGAEEPAPGIMYLRRFQDGLIRPTFFFGDLPQTGPADRQSTLPFRYQVDDRPEQRAMAILQGRQVLMLQPTRGGFEDLGPALLESAARGRKLKVTLELKPAWVFEANYDVSEMAGALDQFKKDRDRL